MTKKLVLGFSIIFILLESILIAYFTYTDFVDLQEITSNSLISDNHVAFLFKDNPIPSVHEIISRYPNVTLLTELYNNKDLIVWGICGNCYLDSKIKSMITGTFFNKHDFFRGDYRAVVGKNILNSEYCFKDKDGKQYFKYENISYMVIGSVASNISNMLDNTVYVNLDSINIGPGNKFIIDSPDLGCINATVNNIRQDYDINIVKENNNFIERYIFNGIDKYMLNTLIFIFTIILLMMLSFFIIRYYSEEIKVKRIIGINFNIILFNIYKDIFLLTVLNTAFLAAIYTFVYYFILANMHLSFYLLSFLVFSLAILLITSLIIYIYVFISNYYFCKSGVK